MLYECKLPPYNCTVPTVGGVEALALTLDTIQVDITVSDDGGQPVLEYTVSQACGNGEGFTLQCVLTITRVW